jgi:hypothetical protein
MKLVKNGVILTCVAAMAGAVSGGTIISVSAPQGTVGTEFDSGSALYVGWAQSNGYTNVSIAAYLSSADAAPVGYTAYLTNSVGSGATAIANEIASGTFTMAAGVPPTYETLFSGLTLGPGEFYLVLVGLSPSPVSWQTPGPEPSGPVVLPSFGIHLNDGVLSAVGTLDIHHRLRFPIPTSPETPSASTTWLCCENRNGACRMFQRSGANLAIPCSTRSWPQPGGRRRETAMPARTNHESVILFSDS